MLQRMLDPVAEVERYLAGPPKVSQTEFGEAIGASQSMVSRIIDGKAFPTLLQAARIRDIVGIPVDAWTKPARKVATKRARRAA